MKRKISFTIALVMLFTMLFGINAFAASNVSVSGPSSAQSGATITFTVGVSNSAGITSFSANIGADSGLVVTSVSGCPSGWLSQSNNNKIVVAGSTTVTRVEVTVKCKISGDVGTSKKLYVSGINTSNADGDDESVGGTIGSNAVTIAAPLSGDCTLSALNVSNATLSPAFNSNTTAYSCGTVPFATTRLAVSTKTKDSNAKATVSGTSLAVGANTVRITVAAPNGAKKTYTINVTREQDPNYVASNNADLSGITLSAGQLSPAFSESVKEYVVYLPFEVDKISITGTAKEAKSKGVENITDQTLELGDNVLKLKCTAEDGTSGEYTIHVVRMTQFSDKASLVVPTLEKPTEATTEPTTQAAPQAQGVSPVLMGILALVCLIFGFAIGTLIGRKKHSGGDGPDDFDGGSDDFGNDDFGGNAAEDFEPVNPDEPTGEIPAPVAEPQEEKYDGNTIGYIDYNSYIDK